MANQPWREMGLKDHEYERIVELMGREPNRLELGLFASMWSEHCSYKHSKPVLKTFPTTGPRVLVGPGENAGVVDIGVGQAGVFKMESHNHPSAVEPYHGAATGVGGIVRDVFAMGARPIALANSLRFGDLTEEHQRHLLQGAVAGMADYGNTLEVPTIAGEVYFHEGYSGNCLVNAMCVGLVGHDELAKGVASGVGNPVLVLGAPTGREGIHGATFASDELSGTGDEVPEATQKGNPELEKRLMEACLELIDQGIIVGMQDLGAAGFTSSGSEMASRADTGLELDVDLIPKQEPDMTAYEVMLSETQERMLVVVEPERVADVQAVCAKWGVDATVVGRVTDDGYFRIKEGGRVVAEVVAKHLTDQAPVYQAAAQRPAWQDSVQQLALEDIDCPDDLNSVLLQLLASPNIACKAWIYQQFDHQAQGQTLLPAGSNAGIVRVPGTNKGLAVSVDCNSRYVYLDPYVGGMIAVAEAARNLVCSGADPLAITNCLNFGSPERPEIFWQLQEAVRGMGEACRALGTPVTGGNVSLYNETNGQAIYPTPTVGIVGLLPEAEQLVTHDFKETGDVIILLGETKPEIGGSEYLHQVHGQDVGAPPSLDLTAEVRLQQFLLDQIRQARVRSAHDCAEGGLAVTIAEAAIAGQAGCQIDLGSTLRPDVLLFAESQSRVVVTVAANKQDVFLAAAQVAGVPAQVLGTVGGQRLTVRVNGTTRIDVELAEAAKAWQEAIPCLMQR
ncbi:MAG: phosphoribosylformylglycinamidine synthase subunit PurL [Firmicutes bacterium]|nr:phosphoribosylformylglycinamidine synthase subunit PurL [Bacillota bacterium]